MKKRYRMKSGTFQGHEVFSLDGSDLIFAQTYQFIYVRIDRDYHFLVCLDELDEIQEPFWEEAEINFKKAGLYDPGIFGWLKENYREVSTDEFLKILSKKILENEEQFINSDELEKLLSGYILLCKTSRQGKTKLALEFLGVKR